MLVLGLDPSLTNFGWCLLDSSLQGKDRILRRGRFHTSSKSIEIERFLNLRNQLSELLKDSKVFYVGCESPIFGATQSEAMYALYIQVNEALYKAGCNVAFFSPPQLKAHARLYLGRPTKPKLWKMEKEDMIEAAKKECGGVGCWTSDEADAYWAGRVGARFWSLYENQLVDSDLTEVERQQFLEIKKPKRGKKAGRILKMGLAYKEDKRFFLYSQKEF